MPRQEVFLAGIANDKIVRVLKSYDQAFAKEAFSLMEEPALRFLASSLDLEEPVPTDASFSEGDIEGLWEEVEDGARESWDTFSYFVVEKEIDGASSPSFVSADWPTAEAFIKTFFPDFVSTAVAL